MRYIIFSLVALALFLGGGIANAANQKVTVCHVTSSEKNPFVEITVSVNALNAHLGHGDFIAPIYGCELVPPPPPPPPPPSN
jgi:hypothetical protein